MRHRINDLTGKLSCTQRSLKLITDCMSRGLERRRSDPSSRATADSTFSRLPPDFGGTLHDLERKIDSIQLLMSDGKQASLPDDSLTPATSVRRSLDGCLRQRLSCDDDCSDSHGMLLRLHQLSASVRKISDSLVLYCDTTKTCTASDALVCSSGSWPAACHPTSP